MAFIETSWHLWLAATAIFYILTFVTQISMMKRIDRVDFSSVLNGFSLVAVFAFLANICAIVLVLSVVLNVISYVK